MARPFLKWAGGKTQLLPEIEARLPDCISECSKYSEPFLGGGSVLFRILEKFDFESVRVSDINHELVMCYTAVRDDYKEVAAQLSKLEVSYPTDKEGQKEFYYGVRDEWNAGVNSQSELIDESIHARVAKTIFLNKTCFNGLFRVNKQGLFNVPCNYTAKPSFPSEANFREVHNLLQNSEIVVSDFEECEDYVDNTTFVYFDPPYRPLSETSGFVSYSKGDFDDDDQRKLADLFKRLDAKGAKLMLSNSDPKNSNREDDFFDELYSKYRIERVYARRAINSVGTGRGLVNELIITNY